MVQLLTRALSAVLSCSTFGPLCWKLATAKKEASSRGVELDLMLPPNWRLQNSSYKVKDKAIHAGGGKH